MRRVDCTKGLGSARAVKDYIFFWGCTIPNRFPFLEKSMRLVLGKLGVRFKEIEGFTCCPEKFLVMTLSEEAWHLTAARNLALAEREGADLLVPCNGCYSTFRQAISDFAADAGLRHMVKERLAQIGLDYDFKTGVHHVVEVLHDSLGPAVIARKVERPMAGMVIAPHYGCQVLRPWPVVRLDDALHPVKLDRLIEAIGARSLDYPLLLNCCGESLSRTGNSRESEEVARDKLLEVDSMGADAISVICPACFQQFDTVQSILQREIEGFNVPVFFYTELLGLALGIEASEMGFDMHRADVTPFMERWQLMERERGKVADCFDYDAMRTCVECASCSSDCPVAQLEEGFEPHSVLSGILQGRLDEVVDSDDIWKCLECGTCTELCPNNFGMTKVFKEAKRLAIDKGREPPEAAQGADMFKKTGMLGKERGRARAKLGLGPKMESGGEELKKLLERTFNKE